MEALLPYLLDEDRDVQQSKVQSYAVGYLRAVSMPIEEEKGSILAVGTHSLYILLVTSLHAHWR